VFLDQRGGGVGDAQLLGGKAVFADVKRRVEAKRLINGLAGEHGATMGTVDQPLLLKAREIAANTGGRGGQLGGKIFHRGFAVTQQQP
jgi:hypothetical protein